MEFYKILQNIMTKNNLSIPDIARATNLSDSTLRSIISRKTKNISLDVAFKLSEGLGISLEELNGENPITYGTNSKNTERTTKTEKLKHIILSKYNSIREFARIAEIPSTTLTSALDKDIGGMAVDRFIKICELLNVDIKTLEPLDQDLIKNTLSDKETTLLENFNKLNDIGKNKVITYTHDLLDNPKFSTNDELCATVAEKKEDYLMPIAAHDDNLTDEEKNMMNEKINKFLKK